jgi:hypothetical protein
MKSELPKLWTGVNLASALTISLLSAFLLSGFVIGLLEHEDLDILAYTGGGSVALAMMSVNQVRTLWREARLKRVSRNTASPHPGTVRSL